MCPKCGSQAKGLKFCGECGHEIANAPTPLILGESPSKRSVGSQIVRGLLFSLAALFLIGFLAGILGWTVDTEREPTPRKMARVTYIVAGSGPASLTYHNASGGTEQQDVKLPWSLEFNAPPGSFVYLSAQKKEEYGVIFAQVFVNAVSIQKAESNSPYGIASVSGSVPR